jgi:very-short-patch-repair endonuclease
MAPPNVQATLRAFWALVAAQHGVVSRAQLLELGFTPAWIRWRVRVGKLHIVRPGVYAVGRPELTPEGRWMAAVLSCGAGAHLSHGSAAELLLIEHERPGLIEVSVPASRNPRGDRDLIVHRSATLNAQDIGDFKGIPVTSPARTLLDLATRLDQRCLEAAINAADKHDHITPPALRAYLDDGASQPGVRALRNLLDHHTFTLTDSDLERHFIPLALRAGLPQPLTQQRLNGFRVDFYWPDLGLVVETDGLRYHRTPAEQGRDRLRDQAHVAAGLTPLRFTHRQVRYEPNHVQAVLQRTASQLARR